MKGVANRAFSGTFCICSGLTSALLARLLRSSRSGGAAAASSMAIKSACFTSSWWKKGTARLRRHVRASAVSRLDTASCARASSALSEWGLGFPMVQISKDGSSDTTVIVEPHPCRVRKQCG